MLINKLMAEFFNLLGVDYQDYRDALLDEGPAGQAAAMGAVPTDTAEGPPADMASNQTGMPVSSPEMMARGMNG